MYNVFSAVHVFTDQTDSAVKIFRRELEYIQKRRYEITRVSRTSVIRYPHAVTFAYSMNMALDYLAKDYSKRLNAPVLVSGVMERTMQSNSEQLVILSWGLENKCIARMETALNNKTVSSRFESLDILKSKLGRLLKEESILFSPYGWQTPMNFISALSDELGIFLGGEDAIEFLERCSLIKEYMIGGIYDAGDALTDTRLQSGIKS